jgi:hypothetical protein
MNKNIVKVQNENKSKDNVKTVIKSKNSKTTSEKPATKTTTTKTTTTKVQKNKEEPTKSQEKPKIVRKKIKLIIEE